jgi:hypothetical protein
MTWGTASYFVFGYLMVSAAAGIPLLLVMIGAARLNRKYDESVGRGE